MMTKLKLTLVIEAASLWLASLVFAAYARKPHICTRKLRLVLRVLLLVWAAGSAGVLGSAQSLAQNAYITNWSSDTVSVIDTNTNSVIATISVGNEPFGVAVTSDGRRVYIANEFSVSVIDAVTNAVITTIPIAAQPPAIGVAVTPDGRKAYVSNYLGNTVSVIDTTTNTVTGTITVSFPFGLAVTPDGRKLYVTNLADTNSVSVIETATDTVIATTPVGNRVGPLGVAVTPDGRHVYITEGGSIGQARCRSSPRRRMR